MIIICDIDGTLADISHRLHYIDGETKDWDAFFNACPDDEPHKDIINLLTALAYPLASTSAIVYVSGRSEKVRDQTITWLLKHGAPTGELRMRPDGDHRPDYALKAELVADLRPQDVWFWLDDRDQVVQMARRKGYRVLQVADGSF